MEKVTYLAPQCDTLDIAVEQGFATSPEKDGPPDFTASTEKSE